MNTMEPKRALMRVWISCTLATCSPLHVLPKDGQTRRVLGADNAYILGQSLQDSRRCAWIWRPIL